MVFEVVAVDESWEVSGSAHEINSGRREAYRAILACALGALIFLSPALLRGQVISPASVLFSLQPWRDQAPSLLHEHANGLLIDSAAQFEPWLAYSAQRVRSGEIPLWNAQNMLGAPFLGNMQSAVFYPPNWIYFLMPGGVALFLRVWVKLFLASLGTYLFARQVLKVRAGGAAIASVAYAGSTFMTVWLLHPHTAVACWLPWLWWATAMLISSPNPRRAAILSVTVALSLLAGHPETSYHVFEATGLFALFSLYTAGSGGFSPLRAARALGWWVAAFFLGTSIAGAQLLPFLEYTYNSYALFQRGVQDAGSLVLPIKYAWTTLSPELFGNPARMTVWGTPFAYNEANNYCGALPLLLAPFAFFRGDRYRRRCAIFLVALTLIAAAIVYHAPVVSDALLLVPGMHLALNIRLLLIIQFSVALLGGLGFEVVAASVANSSRRHLYAMLGAQAALLLAGIGALWIFRHSYFGVPGMADSSQANDVWRNSLVQSLGMLIAGAGVVAAWIYFSRKYGSGKYGQRWARVLQAGVVILLGADLLTAHADYIPSVDANAYFPATRQTAFLRDQPGTFRISAAGDILLPQTNQFYGISDLRGNDALTPLSYQELVAGPDHLATERTQGDFTPSGLLDTLNVRYVLSAPGDDPRYIPGASQGINTDSVGEITRRRRVGQTFIATRDNLASIQVLGATFGGQARGLLKFHLKSAPSDVADLFTQTLDAGTLPDNAYWTVKFPPIAGSRGRTFYFGFDASQTGPGIAATLWYNRRDAYTGGSRFEGADPAKGDLVFRSLYTLRPDDTQYAKVLDGGEHGVSIFENKGALPRAWLAHETVVITDTSKQVATLRDPSFNAREVAVLDKPLPVAQSLARPPSSGAADKVSIESYESERVTINTDSGAAGLLVLSDQWFPGWEASVDGSPAEIVTADHALRAVFLKPGTHVVRFTYAPISFKVGLALTLLGLAGVIGLLITSSRARHGS